MANEPDLFDVKRRQPAKMKAAPTTAPGVIQRLIGVYRSGYERRFHEPPVILKREGQILKSLVSQFGAEKVEARLRAFLEWTDPFVVDSGYALTVFQSQWNRLAARCVQQQPATREMGVDKTQEYLRSLRSAQPLKAVK